MRTGCEVYELTFLGKIDTGYRPIFLAQFDSFLIYLFSILKHQPANMPSADVEKVKSSWADQMDDDVEDSADRQVEITGNNKLVTEITYVDGDKCKVTKHYRVEKRIVPKVASQRKHWAKFGQSASDPPGPNLATTIISDDVKMEFLSSREEDQGTQEQDNTVNQFGGNQAVQCRNCGLNHWTLHCPYKNQFNALNKLNENVEGSKDDRNRKPGLGGKSRIDLGSRSKDENNTIRITNLPEETQDSDIRDLFKDFGRITRIFLAKDKATGNSKGFAFVSFEMREQAQRAIKTVNGHGYNNLILSVEWARPSGN